MSCPICEKESRDKLMKDLPDAAKLLCHQCQKNAKQSARLTARFDSDRRLKKRVNKKITLMQKSCAEIFSIDDHVLSKKEFKFLEEIFIANFPGYMKQRWPMLKLERIYRYRINPPKKITESQFNHYVIKKLNNIAKSKRALK